MSDKEKITTLGMAIMLAMLLMLAGFFVGYKVKPAEKELVFRHDTIVTTDTIHVDHFIEVEKKVIKYKDVCVTDTIVRNDTIFAVLPYEQRHYHMDSLADIWVSGIEPRLDSANIVNRERTIVESVVERETCRKSSVGLMVGTMTSSAYYQRDIGRFQLGGYAGADYKGKVQLGMMCGFRF